ncbi:cystine transporter subunit [Gammaproteobacteria bacterium]|nr:cystine transporter subunit [Gammaproteobacteria bacterium]
MKILNKKIAAAFVLITSFVAQTPLFADTDHIDKIKVGTEGTYNPFTYKDEQGVLTGYDVEVLREVDRRDPTLEFEFIASPWDTLFLGLDANRFQVLANQIVSNPDREKRYYMTDYSYFTGVSQLIVKGGRTDIKSMLDLKGKKVASLVGSSHTRALEDWNMKNNNIFKITYYEGDITLVLQDIQNGRIDATINDPLMAQDKAKIQGLNIQVIGDERIAAAPTRFLFQKNADGLRLKQKIDRALKSMTEDGTLSQMSLKQFGKDYTK